MKWLEIKHGKLILTLIIITVMLKLIHSSFIEIMLANILLVEVYKIK